MHRFVATIIVQSVKGQVFRNPIGDFRHIFVVHQKVDSRSGSATDGCSATIQFMTCVLIQFWRDPP